MITRAPLVLGSDMLDEAKAYLRLETDDEDAPMGAFLLAAIGHAEGFLNQLLIRRTVTEILPVCREWTRLGATPVAAISGVMGLPAEGAAFAMPVGSYAIDIDASGDGWVRVTQPGAAGRVEVTYTAGFAPDWSSLPDAIRLGTLRLLGHLFSYRDNDADAGPPAAVAALLRPWRRMRLS
jgi:uncharacterized phiE125 gp8 family phage protein